MKMFTYTIKDREGVHARPAGVLVTEAKKYSSTITLTKDKSADLKRIFGVMGLGIKQNDVVTVTIDGSDEAEAYEAIKKAFEENL